MEGAGTGTEPPGGCAAADSAVASMASAKISGSRTSSQGAHSVPSLPEDLSYQYWSSCCLTYDDKLCDGFYEVHGQFPEAVTHADDFPSLAALDQCRPRPGGGREVLLFDSRDDPDLGSIISETADALASVSCMPNRNSIACYRQVALVVAGRMGGPQASAAAAAARASRHIEELQARAGSVVLPIGRVFNGSARHRALLFKFLADAFGLRARVMKGQFYAESKNDARLVIELAGEELEMDLLVRPGTSAPLEQKIALRASSREVAGTDLFSGASGVSSGGGSTPATAPASRTPSDGAQVEPLMAAAVASQQALRERAANGPPDSQITSFEQALQMAAAAAMGASPFEAQALGPGSPAAAHPGHAPEPSPSIPSMAGASDSSGRFSFGGGHTPRRSGGAYADAGRYSSGAAPYSPLDSLPPGLQAPPPPAWAPPYVSGGFGSPMPSSMYSGRGSDSSHLLDSEDVPRLSAGDLLEMGPPALISDASGQQYLVQPVRASAEFPIAHRSRSSLDYGVATPTSASSRHLAAGASGGLLSPDERSLGASHSLRSREGSGIDAAGSGGSGSGGITAAEALLAHDGSQQLLHRTSTPPQLRSVAEGVPMHMLDHQAADDLAPPPIRSSWSGPETMLQRAALLAAGAGAPVGMEPAGRPASAAAVLMPQRNRTPSDAAGIPSHPGSYAESVDVTRLYLDGLRSGSAAGVRMSVPVEWEQRQALLRRQDSAEVALAASGRNSPPPAEAKPASRSSGGGVPFPGPDPAAVPQTREGSGGSEGSGPMFTPFGVLTDPLSASSPSTVASPKNSSATGTSRSASLTEPPQQAQPAQQAQARQAMLAAAAAAAATTATTPFTAAGRQGVSPRTGRTLSPRHHRLRSLSPSTLSTLVSGGLSITSYDSVEDEGWEIAGDELQLGPRIGIGSYGEVYRGQWRQTDVAVKMFLDQELGARMIDSFRKEVAIMKKLRHPNIVQFIGACTKPPKLCIVTQYVHRGSLFKLLHRAQAQGTHLDERRRLQMALDVCRGMNYLHTCRPPVIHRDLKSPNLLVDKDLTIKVCDFGLSRVRHATVLSAKSQAGTPEWTAPEVLQGKSCNESSDVYSFGVILWELLTGEEPWGEKTAMQVVGAVGFAGERLPVPEGCRPALADLLNRCFGDPNDRPSFSEIIPILKRQVAALAAAPSASPPSMSSKEPSD